MPLQVTSWERALITKNNQSKPNGFGLVVLLSKAKRSMKLH